MAIGFFSLQFLLHEHSHKPITGNVLTIGRQAVAMAPEGVLATIEDFGIEPRSREFSRDEQNQHGGTGPLLTDKSFFAAFTDCTVSSADISPYEGADYVFDICGDVPRKLRGRFDFIIDGGSLDNIFDPVRMMSNMVKMLKPGGRIYIFAWSNSHPTAYAKVTPDWLMDYFAVNEFVDAKVYPVEFPVLRSNPTEAVMTAFQYDPHVVYSGQTGYECSSIFSERPLQTHCIAETGKRTTSDRSAVQKHYRGANTEPYLSSMARFRASPRPVFRSPHSTALTDRSIGDYETIQQVARWEMKEHLWRQTGIRVQAAE